MGGLVWIIFFRFTDFEFASDFELRISDFLPYTFRPNFFSSSANEI
jgi:hypothetical protein